MSALDRKVAKRDRLRAAVKSLPDTVPTKRGKEKLEDLRDYLKRQIDKLTVEIRCLKLKGERWHPDAIKTLGNDAGGFKGGGRKICLHTTEGSSASGAISAYSASNSWPHFTLEWIADRKKMKIYQHVPLDRAARALAHPSGPETNRANCIQIELVGFAKDTQDWGKNRYAAIAEVTHWIECAFGVPRKSGLTFEKGARRLGGQEFYDFKGYCGHMHVPGNDHWDPGSFKINRLL